MTILDFANGSAAISVIRYRVLLPVITKLIIVGCVPIPINKEVY